jgi:hypothetical protein
MAEITRTQVIEAARSYKGVPYAQQGRDRETGLDCVGLLIKVGHDTGYTDFDFLAYGSNPDGETMERLLNEHLDKLDTVEEALPGDVLSMDFGASPQHCGFITKTTDRGIAYWNVVHSIRNHGVVEGRLFSKYLNSAKAVYRLRGITD